MMNLADDLQKLHTLREQGALTEEEYIVAKKRLLDAAAEPVAPPKPKAPDVESPLRRFKRSDTDRWVGGVAGGLAEVTGIPSWTWRILFVLTTPLHGIGLIMYVLLWIFVPLQIRMPQVLVPPPPRD